MTPGLAPLATTAEVLTQLFTALTVAILGIAVPLVWAAVRGYEGTPWGRVIAPLPWIVGALLLWAIGALLPLSIWVVGTFSAIAWGVSTVAIVVLGVRAFRLFTGRVKL
ncbi:MAG: hypothetical protein U5J98_02710 [Halobacteriales archaeon]|nr:hypothetical protein [Halobacteriales archaeon]